MAAVGGDGSPSDLRREARRRKILQGSEQRMKKITGYNAQQQDANLLPIETASPSQAQWMNHAEVPLANDAARGIWDDLEFSTIHPESKGSYRHSAEVSSPLASAMASSHDANTLGFGSGLRAMNGTSHPGAATPTSTTTTATAGQQQVVQEYTAFNRFRTVVFLLVGILVRISLSYALGKNYVQNILNPFIAIEIAIIGYQKAVDMDLGVGVQGGLWLSTMVLSGVRQDIIHTYKTLMGALAAAAGDFTIFFLAFVLTHLAFK